MAREDELRRLVQVMRRQETKLRTQVSTQVSILHPFHNDRYISIMLMTISYHNADSRGYREHWCQVCGGDFNSCIALNFI